MAVGDPLPWRSSAESLRGRHWTVGVEGSDAVELYVARPGAGRLIINDAFDHAQAGILRDGLTLALAGWSGGRSVDELRWYLAADVDDLRPVLDARHHLAWPDDHLPIALCGAHRQDRALAIGVRDRACKSCRIRALELEASELRRTL